MTRPNLTRRTFVGGAAAVAVGLAGCAGGSGDGSSDSGGADGGSNDGTSAGDSSNGSGGDGGSTPSFDGYLGQTSNYDGVADRTGEDEVTVTVGAEANGGNFGFGPAAVRVSTGTTVVWEWNGQGVPHDVVAEDGTFQSEQASESGHTFSHTFEEAGTTKYYCTPHQSMGMRGVVVVEE